MTILEAIEKRHSVRSYVEKEIPQEVVEELKTEIEACNKESGLHIQLITNEPKAFDNFMAHYGKFSGVQNYIALIGPKSASLDEAVGYYGERLALFAQMHGLNTCWVAMTFSKGAAKSSCHMDNGEKLVCVLTLGYGSTQGVPHKVKELKDVCTAEEKLPGWFVRGMNAALLAPTATNQQKFRFEPDGNQVAAKSTGGFYSKVDLGIVKYHFEVGAGTDNFTWK